MNLSKISVRYAKALFQIAEEKGLLDEISADLKLLYNASQNIHQFEDFLLNPVLSLSEKKAAFHRIFTGNLHPLTLDFIDLLIKNNRLSFVEAIARQYNERYKDSKGITEITFTTTIPVDKAIQEAIFKQIGFKASQKIELDERIDPDIIGGFILKIEDKQIDSSVKTKLNKIKKELVKNTKIVR
ncbi:MAG: ATP synthase F1 subunit delta [Bacteroidetes bacterium]|nr:MAG: ATP synthase F1 subunit delta [Bacteroidota bacterium]